MPNSTGIRTPLPFSMPSLQRAEKEDGEKTEKRGKIDQNAIRRTQGHEAPT
jgi:hypothetical protein